MRVEEIEAAIDQLPEGEFFRLAEWLHAREQQRWDEQMDRDAEAGKLDFLLDEARSAQEAGTLRPWPRQE